MKKETPTTFPIHQLIAERWSPVAFADKAVEAEKLGSILEATRWAPSCYNEQPWTFLVATKDNPGDYTKILSCLVDANKEWAQTAPVLMISVASLRFARNDNDNRHGVHDVGLAASNLCTQATALGLSVHQMAGFDVDTAHDTLGIPRETHTPVAAIAVGYIGDATTASEKLQQRQNAARSRKPLSDIVNAASWKQPFSLAE